MKLAVNLPRATPTRLDIVNMVLSRKKLQKALAQFPIFTAV